MKSSSGQANYVMDRYTANPLGRRLQDLYQGTAFISELTHDGLVHHFNMLWPGVSYTNPRSVKNIRHNKAKAVPLHATKALEGRGGVAPTHTVDGDEWPASRPGPLNPGERTPAIHCTGGWVDLRAGLDTEARGKFLSPLPGIKPRSPGSPAHSQTLY
jgi:hypothetical protein